MISPEVLRHYPNFAGLPYEKLKDIAMISRLKSFEAGEELFTEGNRATHMMIVVSGEIHIVYQLGNGDKVIADTLVAGDPLAWSALLDPHYLTASGVARNTGSLLEIEAEALRSMCTDDTEFGYIMMKEIAKTLRSRLSAMRVQTAARALEPA